MTDRPERIDAVESLGDQDAAVIDKVRAVLEEHGALDRFGLTLLHSHFDIGDDEVLVERVDAETRTLTIRPEKKAVLDEEADPVVTSWRLRSDGGLEDIVYCYRPRGSQFHMR
jgi:hypothetical protein